MSTTNIAMLHARRLELRDHPAPPPGAEVHATGIRHEVQRGDSATGIARDYSQAYHMDISATALQRTNSAAFADGLHPGELLTVPGLEARFDSYIAAAHPRLRQVGDQARHVVGGGETLSSIARHYRQTEGLRLSWQQLHAANRTTIGADPDRLSAGQQLVVPGITTAGARQALQTVSELDQDLVLTRMGRVREESGAISQQPVMHFVADGSHAEQRSSLSDAVRAARSALSNGTARSNPIAIMQTRDGAFHTVPLRGSEAEGLDDSTTTLSLAYRADDRGVVAVVAREPGGSAVSVRRFDR